MKIERVYGNENNEMVINNFTSKLGKGYLVIHDLKDIFPLYGPIFFVLNYQRILFKNVKN